MITYDDFKKVEIRAGRILSAEKIPDTDKLLRLTVDMAEKNEDGTPKPRQIISGIAMYFPDPATLVGKTCMFVANLEPRTIRGFESQGMLFAISNNVTNADGTTTTVFSLLEPQPGIMPGTCAA
jgi:methionine--tRNA ligase beta chain